MKAIVIDPWSRALQTFVASVVRGAEAETTGDVGIHLRFAAEMGNLWELAAGASRAYGSDELGLVVLGATYSAQSSAGFTDVVTPGAYDNGNAVVTGACGCLGVKALRKIKPQKAWVWGPGKWLLFPLQTHENSNCATADAARTGLKFLASVRQIVIIAEGQSDFVSALAIGGRPEWFEEGSCSGVMMGLKPLSGEGRMTREELMALPVEHHQFAAPAPKPAEGNSGEVAESAASSSSSALKWLRWADNEGLILVAEKRGFGFALYAESSEAFPGSTQEKRPDPHRGTYETVWRRRLGGWEGPLPVEIEDEAVLRGFDSPVTANG